MSFRLQSAGESDEWYTPAYVFKALNCRFDLDVAHPAGVQTHVPASRIITRDSLDMEWSGYAWMNPPFGGRNGLVPWLQKFTEHGNGIALVPDRTSAPWWQTYAGKMDAVMLVSPKIKFLDACLQPMGTPAQGSTLMAVGARGVSALLEARRSGLGLLMQNWRENE